MPKKKTKRHPIDNIYKLDAKKKVKSVKIAPVKKGRVKYYRIIRLMPGKKHALVETNVGNIKKELRKLSPDLIKEYEEKETLS